MTPKSSAARTKYESGSSRYVLVDGLRVHYRVEGTGPTLLLLHGVVASLHAWDGWVDELAASFRLVRIDLPGFGLSDRFVDPTHYTPEHSLRFLDILCARLELEDFFLAGNSLGGFLAWFYAAHRPDRVRKLILIDPIAYPQALPGLITFVSLPVIGELARYIAPRFMVAHNIRRVWGEPSGVSAQLIDRYHELLMHGENRAAMVQYFRAIKRLSRDSELAGAIRKIEAPTLLMWGAKDRWVPSKLIESWQRDLKRLELRVYPTGGHVVMEELPRETAHDAHVFLARNP